MAFISWKRDAICGIIIQLLYVCFYFIVEELRASIRRDLV